MNPLSIIPAHLNQRYDQIWQQSGVEETYLALINERFDLLVKNLHSYNSESSELGEFKASLEMLAYTTTELLAQLASGGMRWLLSDKTRFLSPTIDIDAIIKNRALEDPYFAGFGEFFNSIKLGAWDFLQVSEYTRSWFEALDFNKEEVGYLLWAAYKTLNLLRSQERVLGFTPIALTLDEVLDTFCKCESPIESVLYMQLAVDGLLPPVLQAQWHVGSFRLDFAIPDGKIAIGCDGVKYHDEVHDRYRDEELREMGWIIFRFSSKEILQRPDQCSDKIHSQYPWTTLHSDATSSTRKIVDLVKLFDRPEYLYGNELTPDKFQDLVNVANEYNFLESLKSTIEGKLNKEIIRLRANELTLEYDPNHRVANMRVNESRERIANLRTKMMIIEGRMQLDR